MITCNFENRGKETLCEYLCSTIRSQITASIIPANSKMPSRRSLAQHLGISVMTVSNAYAQLIAEGYIYSIERKGYFATDLPPQSTMIGSSTPTSVSELPNSSSVIFRSPAINKIVTKRNIDLANGSISYEKFPFSSWSKIMRNILRRPHEELLKSSPTQGIYALRNAIASYLQRFRGMNVQPEQIVIGAGSEYLYGVIINLLGRNRAYAVENPGYLKTAAVLTLNGASCIPIPLDSAGFRVDRLQQSTASIVHVSPAHHFPTGIVMPVKRRRELLAWAAADSSRIIIEDDYDSEFRFTGKPLQTLQSACTTDSVIYMNTFSKTLAPSYRISYMVLPQQLLPEFQKRLGFCACTVSGFEQYALAQFISEGLYEKHIIRMKNYYRTLRDMLITSIRTSNLAKNVGIQEQNAGLHFLLKLKTTLYGKSLTQSLLSNGIQVSLLSNYFLNSTIDNDLLNQNNVADTATARTLVINYSGLQKSHISETVSRLACCIDPKKHSHT